MYVYNLPTCYGFDTFIVYFSSLELTSKERSFDLTLFVSVYV